MSELISERIREHAERLRLTHLAENAEQLIARAEGEQRGYRELLDLALEEELGVREGRRFVNALKLSGLPHHKGLDDFDFAFQRLARRPRVRPPAAPPEPQPRPETSGRSVVRTISSNGSVSFAGTDYRVGNAHRGEQVEVRIVGDAVEISRAGELLKSCPVRHDRFKEHGAYATPSGRPERSNASPFSTVRRRNTATGANA